MCNYNAMLGVVGQYPETFKPKVALSIVLLGLFFWNLNYYTLTGVYDGLLRR